MDKFRLACPCLLGFESIVADELRGLDCEDVELENGRVVFSGSAADIARTNINLRCAERVLVLLAEFETHCFEDLFQGVKNIPWEDFIGREDAFPVKGWSLKSALHSVPDCQKIIKKAVVERLKGRYRVDWFKETGAKIQIQFSIMKDRTSIYLDTTGEGLHKRGYRENSNEAPIKETLAAAMVKLARPFPDKWFCDPMCGSGTILIEAAMMMQNIAPGLERRFAAENWGCLPKEIWNDARTQALGRIQRKPCMIMGYDIDPKAVELTLQNAKKAGVGEVVRAEQQDIRALHSDDRRGIVVCNPPYGDRMLEVKQADELIRELGRAYQRLQGWHFYVISPSEQFEGLFGRKADKRRKLYNGMIRCEYFQYFRR